MLEDVLTDNKVLINKRADNWQEAIELAAQPLLKEGYIKSSYIEAMIEAVEEHGPYIVLGKHLALPHARPEEGVNQLGVSVATFPDGVNFGHEELDPVKIVFCLAATDSYSHLNIMKELVSLINDSEKLEKLINSKKVEEFKKIIFD